MLCDLGTSNAESSHAYGKIRARLTSAGLPVNRIRFTHHAAADSAEAALFADCRAGVL